MCLGDTCSHQKGGDNSQVPSDSSGPCLTGCSQGMRFKMPLGNPLKAPSHGVGSRYELRAVLFTARCEVFQYFNWKGCAHARPWIITSVAFPAGATHTPVMSHFSKLQTVFTPQQVVVMYPQHRTGEKRQPLRDDTLSGLGPICPIWMSW